MKKLLLCIFVTNCILFSSYAQIKMPAPSSTQTVKQDFGIGAIQLTYSRPTAKGRKIFGNLVPYNKIWRTGANGATKIVFSDAVEIGGKKIDTGTYVLYTIPGIDTWEVILNKGITNWGTEGYKETEDVVRFKVAPTKIKDKLEVFTMQFADIKPESCQLQIMWEKTAISFPINTNVKEKIKSQLDAAMQSDKKPYWQAAQFYKEYDNNLNKALENINKAIETNDKAYYMWLYKANIQKDMGDNSGALVSSQKSLVLAKEAKNDDYVKLNEDLQKKLK